MMAYSLNTFTLFTIYLCSILHPSHGFNVTQPQSRTVSLQGITSITCEHNANNASVEDVQLIGISITDKRTILCQKGWKSCKNIVMYKENHNKWLFILFNIESEAFKIKYQCEFTVKEDDLDITRTGSPTTLCSGKKDVACLPYPTSPTPPSSSPAPPHAHLLRWILIGFLALMLLYSCVITSFYIRLKIREGSDKGPDNSTYVEMRKAPPRNPPLGI